MSSPLDKADSNLHAILVFFEVYEGEIDNSSLALVGQARELASMLGGNEEIYVILLGEAPGAGSTLGPYGVKKVYQWPEYESTAYDRDRISTTISNLAEQAHAGWIVCGHSLLSGDLAVRISSKLGAGLVARCTDVQRDDTGLSARRNIHGGRLCQQIALSFEGPYVLSWDISSLGRYEPYTDFQAGEEIIATSPHAGQETIRFIDLKKGDPGTIPINEADRIVAMGRGMVPDGVSAVREFADALGRLWV